VSTSSNHGTRKRGLVRHREPYRAIGDLEKVREALMVSPTAEFLDETPGPASREEWVGAAEQDEETRG
jgi:hypothetical protein